MGPQTAFNGPPFRQSRITRRNSVRDVLRFRRAACGRYYGAILKSRTRNVHDKPNPPAPAAPNRRALGPRETR
eukprot:3398775-Prymnesium_polylepis.1